MSHHRTEVASGGARQACITRAVGDVQPVATQAASPETKRKRGRPAKLLNSLLQAQQQFGRRFYIPADEVAAFREQHGVGLEDLLKALIQPASTLALTPVSAYNVGAAGLGSSGAIYLGVNIEFDGRPLNSSVHAEQFLVTNAALHGERKLELLAVTAAPCGHCRQFFCELPDAGNVRFMFGAKRRGRSQGMTLEKLLPLRFGPEDLMEDPSAPRMLEVQRDAPRLQRGDIDTRGNAVDGDMLDAALAELGKSYAPYTHCHAAVALRLEGGGVVAGRYLESAAYNPSLGPLQAAVVAAVISGASPCQVASALLVENSRGPMSHERDVRNLLKCCSKDAQLQVANYARQVPRGR